MLAARILHQGRRTAFAGLLLAIGAGAFADALEGQSSRRQSPDFLFEAPRFTLGVRGGLFFHRAESDLYDFTLERFTLDRSDYRAASVGIDFGAAIGARTDLTLSLDGGRVTLGSEYRDWLEPVESPGGGTTEIPIRQTTRLRHGPAFALGLRWYLLDRGDRLGQFIWIPRTWNLSVGAGGGLTAYQLLLEGDFVDELNRSIHADRYESQGNAPFIYLSAGGEVGLTPRTALTLEGRYQWGDHELGSDFASDFLQPLDLSGARLSMGIQARF